MGLDTVEILVSFEEAFGIDIPDDVAWTLETPAMVIDHIMQQQHEGKTFKCFSMRGFYKLRNALIQEGIASRDAIHPESTLESLIPKHQRRQIWSTLDQKYHLKLPRLLRPQWLVISLMVLINASAMIIAFNSTDANTNTLWVILIVILTLGMTANLLTRPFAIHLPKEYRRMVDLATYTSVHSAHFLLEPHESFSRDQVAAIVKAITMNYCKPHLYREDGHFVKDLGLD